MRFKKYIVTGLSILSISGLLIGCSSKDVLINTQIQNSLQAQVENILGDCDVNFGDSKVCGFDFKDTDNRYQEELFVNIVLKDKSLTRVPKKELEKSIQSKIHKPIHSLYEKYMNKRNSILVIQVKDINNRLIMYYPFDNTTDYYQIVSMCPLCNPDTTENVEIRGGYVYCDLCGNTCSQFEATKTNLPSGEEVIVCPTCLDSINNGDYDNIDMYNAN